MKLIFEFRRRNTVDYINYSIWKKVRQTLKSNEKNNFELFFLRHDDLIYRKKSSHNIFFILRRLCISTTIVKNILNLIHDENYFKCDRTYQQIISFWYIANLTKHVISYIKHCFKYNINQTRRHKSYDNLQFILNLFVSFYTIVIDFTFELSKSHTDLNVIMSIICKYIKRVIAISKMNIWNALKWIEALLFKVNIVDWDFFKHIIFDRDRKFLADLWKNLFNRLKIKLLYITTYHLHVDQTFKRINQIIKIASRFYIQALQNSKDWSKTLDAFQRKLNNNFNFTKKMTNEICYEFTSLKNSDLIRNNVNNSNKI